MITQVYSNLNPQGISVNVLDLCTNPFGLNGAYAAKEKLTVSAHFFDLPENWLDDLFATIRIKCTKPDQNIFISSIYTQERKKVDESLSSRV